MEPTDVPPVKERPPPVLATRGAGKLRPAAYIATGVGVIGVGTFAAFGLMNSATHDRLATSCPDNRCPPGAADDIDTGRMQQTIANVGLIVGIVGIVSGVTLFVVSAPKKAPATAVIGGPGWIGLRGAL